MRHWLLWGTAFVLFLWGSVACGPRPLPIAGPALVFFYTDN